jgi:hypothetical protein
VIATYNSYGGFGTFYSAMPSPSRSVISYGFVTPFGNIAMHTTYDTAVALTAYSFFNPFSAQS